MCLGLRPHSWGDLRRSAASAFGNRRGSHPTAGAVLRALAGALSGLGGHGPGRGS